MEFFRKTPNSADSADQEIRRKEHKKKILALKGMATIAALTAMTNEGFQENGTSRMARSLDGAADRIRQIERVAEVIERPPSGKDDREA